MGKSAKRQDLSLIRASGSTARVINLALAYERHGTEPEFEQRPIFRIRRLNRALILKHAVRRHERSLFTRMTASTTKVILPFAATELELGGISFMVGEQRFERLLREAAGANVPQSDIEADRDLLMLLNSLPSFDPFLMRERLRHTGIEPARCYFEIAEADIARMRAFVSREISQLIQLAFSTGGAGAGELSSKLADKLMTDETAKSLDPLRQTLRLSGDDYVEGVFAWKGFLYYRWQLEEFKPQLAEFKARFGECRLVRCEQAERKMLAASRARIVAQMDAALGRVENSLQAYETAFGALSRGEPTAFRDFLLEAPKLFIPIGEAVGVIKHIHSFWRFRFPETDIPPIMEGEEALEIFHEFETTLESTQFAKGVPTPQPSSAATAA